MRTGEASHRGSAELEPAEALGSRLFSHEIVYLTVGPRINIKPPKTGTARAVLRWLLYRDTSVCINATGQGTCSFPLSGHFGKDTM